MQDVNTAEVDTRELISVPTPKLGISFDDLYDQAFSIQRECTDYMVSDSKRIRMDENTGLINFIHDKQIPGTSPFSLQLTPHSLAQMCAKLGIPNRYMMKLFSAGAPDIAAENVNYWLNSYNRNFFIRGYKDQIRGLLSDRFTAFDTPDIMDVISEVIDSSQYSTKGYFLNPERFHARIVQNEMMNINGEDLFAGIQIDSSDVGRSVLIVRFMIYKQVCTNGLCVSRGGGILFEQRHVGLSLKEFSTSFRESMSRIPTLIENSKDLVEEARRMSTAYDVTSFSESRMKEFTERVRTRTSLSDDSVSKVINMMQEKYTPTKWGLINSLTEVAQDFTLERRLEIEKIAGDMLFAA